MDIWLAVVVGIIQLVLGGMGVYVSLRPPKPEYHWYWLGGFIAVGLVGIGLTGWLAHLGSLEQKSSTKIQEKMGGDISETKRELQESRIEQARMSGHIQGIQLVMENFSKSGIPGMKELAAALAGVIKSARAPDTKVSNKQLCQKAHDLAANVREFQGKHDAEDRDISLEDFLDPKNQHLTREEANALYGRRSRESEQRRQQHEAEFRDKFFVKAKFLRDSIFERLSDSQRESLTDANNQAEQDLTMSVMIGAQNEYGIANYLEEMTKVICPSESGH